VTDYVLFYVFHIFSAPSIIQAWQYVTVRLPGTYARAQVPRERQPEGGQVLFKDKSITNGCELICLFKAVISCLAEVE